MNKTYKKLQEVSQKVITFVKEKFVFEWGTGLGLKTNSNNAIDVGFATTFGETYNNGEWHAYDRFGVDATLGLNEKLDIGLSYEATHYNHGYENVAFNIPKIIGCENSEKNTTIFLQSRKKNAKIDGTFVGLSIDIYLMVGVSVKIGFMI